MIGFQEFPKIARLSRDIVITEKIDGTNGLVYVSDDGTTIMAGSRTRWVWPRKQDNFGFAGWVHNNATELLLKLGPGYHYGEWWGRGIQRGYGMVERRFSLFNTHRWSDPAVRPACCHVVPVLYTGVFQQAEIDHCLDLLFVNGSVAAPGFPAPEGVVIYHTASKTLFKKTIANDEAPKGAAQ